MATDIDSTIALLERGIEEAQQKIRSLRAAINTVCEQAGLPPRYAEAELTVSGSVRLAQIQSDTFYGKKQTPAMREYLEMRRAQGLGPAKPREFYDALKVGGYQFDTSGDENAIIGLRALLRTQPQIFHRLPDGTYGLTIWYPDAKKAREEAAATPKKKGKKRGRAKKTRLIAPSESAKATETDPPKLKLIGASKGEAA
jgi:hypothetical protein